MWIPRRVLARALAGHQQEPGPDRASCARISNGNAALCKAWARQPADKGGVAAAAAAPGRASETFCVIRVGFWSASYWLPRGAAHASKSTNAVRPPVGAHKALQGSAAKWRPSMLGVVAGQARAAQSNTDLASTEGRHFARNRAHMASRPGAAIPRKHCRSKPCCAHSPDAMTSGQPPRGRRRRRRWGCRIRLPWTRHLGVKM